MLTTKKIILIISLGLYLPSLCLAANFRQDNTTGLDSCWSTWKSGTEGKINQITGNNSPKRNVEESLNSYRCYQRNMCEKMDGTVNDTHTPCNVAIGLNAFVNDLPKATGEYNDGNNNFLEQIAKSTKAMADNDGFTSVRAGSAPPSKGTPSGKTTSGTGTGPVTPVTPITPVTPVTPVTPGTDAGTDAGTSDADTITSSAGIGQ